MGARNEVKDFIAEFDLDKSGAINFGEFLHVSVIVSSRETNYFMLQVMDKAKKGMVQGKAKDMVRTIQKGVDHQKVTQSCVSGSDVLRVCFFHQVEGIAGGYHGYTEEVPL